MPWKYKVLIIIIHRPILLKIKWYIALSQRLCCSAKRMSLSSPSSDVALRLCNVHALCNNLQGFSGIHEYRCKGISIESSSNLVTRNSVSWVQFRDELSRSSTVSTVPV
jgi:hypothetical protein